jgi:hypothetical protein
VKIIDARRFNSRTVKRRRKIYSNTIVKARCRCIACERKMDRTTGHGRLSIAQTQGSEDVDSDAAIFDFQDGDSKCELQYISAPPTMRYFHHPREREMLSSRWNPRNIFIGNQECSNTTAYLLQFLHLLAIKIIYETCYVFLSLKSLSYAAVSFLIVSSYEMYWLAEYILLRFVKRTDDGNGNPD